MLKKTDETTTCGDAQDVIDQGIPPETKTMGNFTAQLLTLGVGEIAIKGFKIHGMATLHKAKSAATHTRRQLRNNVWGSITSTKKRENGKYADRDYSLECFHTYTPNGDLVVQAIVERTA